MHCMVNRRFFNPALRVPDEVDAGAGGEIGIGYFVQAASIDVPVHVARANRCRIDKALYDRHMSNLACPLYTWHQDHD